MTDGHTITPFIERLFPPTGTEPTPFRNYVSKGAGLQVLHESKIETQA